MMRRCKVQTNTHTHRESCANFPETSSDLKEKPSGKKAREFLEKHKQKHSPQAEEKGVKENELW